MAGTPDRNAFARLATYASLVVFTGCATGSRSYDPGKLELIRPGFANAGDLVTLFGPPALRDRRLDGEQWWVWRRPLAGNVVGGARCTVGEAAGVDGTLTLLQVRLTPTGTVQEIQWCAQPGVGAPALGSAGDARRAPLPVQRAVRTTRMDGA